MVLSLIEVEIMAVLKGVRSVIWLEKLTRDLGKRDNDNPFIPTLYCDNKNIINFLYNTKHY